MKHRLLSLLLVLPGTMSAQVKATRIGHAPLITVKTSASLAGNVNGPALIRVPDWVQHPLGRYYLYFANHKGKFIRLAYSDTITGPWKIYEPGVLQVKETVFYRPQPDPLGNNMYTHVASPDIYIDNNSKKIILRAHGMWTDGKA